MTSAKTGEENGFGRKLVWLMLFRIVFTTLLLGSTILLQIEKNPSPLARPLLFLYGLIAGVFLLSFIYAVIHNRIGWDTESSAGEMFAYIQTGVDTVIVSLIIFVTGNYSSIFSFLYFMVIIYASILLSRPGSLFASALCAVQYSGLIGLEYYDLITPFGVSVSLHAAGIGGYSVFYKSTITMAAFIAVAILSSLLAEQAKRSRKELKAMEQHVRRVERMAAIGEMAAGLAHEIKNPLASLTGSIQLMKSDGRKDPDEDRLMRIVLREADRLNSLLSDFLLFARPPAGSVTRFELSPAVAESMELFEKDCSCAGRIEIKTGLMPGIWVEMDPAHLRQILWNLLLNASEAIEETGHIDVKVFALRSDVACISITDDGKGISEKDMASIFDPFFTTKPDGTGLGLSIVHRVLEACEGRLDVESRPDSGTTFLLNLRRAQPPTNA